MNLAELRTGGFGGLIIIQYEKMSLRNGKDLEEKEREESIVWGLVV